MPMTPFHFTFINGFQHDCAKKSMKSRAFAHYEHGKATAAAK